MLDVVALGFSSAVGGSLFSVMAPATAIAGDALLLAIALAAVPMTVFGLLYAFMASAIPRSGAAYDWPREFVGPATGFMTAWLRILSNVAVMIALSLVLVRYLQSYVALPVRPAMLAILLAVAAINWFGVGTFKNVQRVLVFLTLAALALFTAAGLSGASWRVHVQDAHGVSAVFLALPILVGLFMGIESSVEVGDEVRQPTRSIPLGIGVSVVLTLAIYLSIAAVSIGALGPERLGRSEAPLLLVSELKLGGLGMPLMTCAAVLALGKSLNASFIVFSRFLFAMGRSGALPRGLASVGAGGVPRRAIIVTFALCAVGLALPDNLIFLFLAVNVPTMIKYFANSLAALRIVQRHPEIVAQARFKLGRRTVAILAIAGMTLAAVIALIGLGSDWRPYAVMGIWALAGLLYWTIRRASIPAIGDGVPA